jgi:hypothetical protein
MKTKQTVSLVSASALAAGMAQGAVNYSGPINTQLTSSTSTSFDLNQDGAEDFIVGFNSSNFAKPYVQGSPSAVPGSTPLARLAADGWYGLPVTAFGALIDSNFLTAVPDTAPGSAPGQAYLFQDNNSTINTVGDWGINNLTEGYVGLEMYDNNGLSQTNFGWVRLIYDRTAQTLTVVDYAYETISGEGIIAGQTNELGAPDIYAEPQSQTVPVGASVQFNVVALARPAPAYQWMAGAVGSGVYTNLADAGNISGSATPTLMINGATPANIADYVVVVSNSVQSVTSGPPATLSVVSPIATPTPQVLFGGLTAHFNVSVSGLSPTYAWQKNGANLSDGGRFSGSTTANLQISNLQPSDSANYAAVLTSGSLVVTSTVSALTVLPASSKSAYDLAVLAAGPTAYYRFNESGDPATNNLLALDNAAAFNGVYGLDVSNGLAGVAGPRPTDGYPGFAADNAAALFTSGDTNSQVTVAPWNLNTSTATFTFWVNPTVIQNYLAAILWSGTNDNTYAGVNYYRSAGTGAGLPGNVDLGYTWNEGGSAAFFFWDSAIMPPLDLWSMVALVIEPSQTTLYVFNTNEAATWPNGTFPAVNSITGDNGLFPFTNQVMAFASPETVGNNPNQAGGAYGFSGVISDLAVFNYALNQDQLQTLYNAALGVLPPVSLQIISSGNNVQLTWGTLGLLEEATNVQGPWTTNVLATSPYTVPATNSHKFYRVLVQ